MPLIRYREKETTPEARALIGELKLNGEPIEVHRGVFYLRSDFLIRHLRRRIENRDDRDVASRLLEVAQIALDWLESSRSIPQEGVIPTEQIGAAIAAFADEMISQKGYDHAECPACGRSYSSRETRSYCWSERSLGWATDGQITYCGSGHVIHHGGLSFSTWLVDFSSVERPISSETRFEMIEIFPQKLNA